MYYIKVASILILGKQTPWKPRNCDVKWHNKNTNILGGRVAIIGKNTFKLLKQSFTTIGTFTASNGLTIVTSDKKNSK